MSSLASYPLSPKDDLAKALVGQLLQDVSVPAAVVDVAKVRENCKAMLAAVKEFGVGFRAHVKTHKTSEITRLQVGEGSKDVRLIVSTLIEAERLIPLLLDYKKEGAKINVLYGVPLGPSQVDRLAAVARELGPGSVSVMLDHPAQLAAAKSFKAAAGSPVSIFIKADSGYHRAGLLPESQEMIELVKAASTCEEEGHLHILGFYSHNSLSYGGSHPDDAMDMLKVEIDACRQAAKHIKVRRSAPLIVSAGASPTALSLQNIQSKQASSSSAANALRATLDLTKSNFELEIHAGVYPLFDLQQVSASSRHHSGDLHDTIAVSVLTEVCSTYPSRTERPEALVSAGVLALAKEPCKDYQGWGVVSPWNMPDTYHVLRDERMIVDRISQEHGILAYENKSKQDTNFPLFYGQKLRIWPNHACITLAMFGWYLIVDSASDRPDKIVDIWVRWRGW